MIGKFKITVIIVLLFAFCTLLPAGETHDAARQGDPDKPEIKKLAPHFQRITFPYGLKTNTGVSSGKDGLLVVDPGQLQTADALGKVLEKMGGGTMKFLVNTHHHGDHTQGNKIAGPDVTLIRSGDLETLTAEGVLKKAQNKLIGRNGKLSFDTYYTLRFNEEEIRFIPAPGAHSNQDMIIHFTGSKVVQMGDLLLSRSFPAVGRNVVKYLEILDTAIDVFPEDAMFVSGHGKDSSMKELKDYREMLRTTAAIIKKGMKKGKTAKQMQEERILKDYEEYDILLDWLGTRYWIDVVCVGYRNNLK